MKALPNFRRALGYVWPQKRRLATILIAVFGVTVFYAASISSILPLLQVMFYQNETLPDWLYRTTAESRLGAKVVVDVTILEDGSQAGLSTGSALASNQPGIEIENVKIHEDEPGPLEGEVRRGDRIIEINGQRGTHYQLLAVAAALPEGEPADLRIVKAKSEEVQSLRIVPLEAAIYSPISLWVADRLPAGRDTDTRFRLLAWVMGGLLVVATLGGIFKFWHEYTVGILVERALLGMRRDIFTHVMRLPMSWYGQQQAGDTISRLARDTGMVEVGVKILFEKMLSEPLKAAAVLAVCLKLNWHLTVLVFLVLPPAGLVIWYLGKKIKKAQRRSSQAWGPLLDLLDERMVGIKILKTADCQRRESLTFFRRARKIFNQQLKIARADSATSPLLEFVGAIAVCAFVLYGGYKVFAHQMEAPMFFLAMACLAGMLAPIRRVANVNNRLQAAEAAAMRIFEILDLPREVDVPGSVELPPLKKGIELQDVTFSYPGAERPALCNVSLTIRAGETLAIVGPNGSGKTTMSSLLLRFYDPDSGKILLDGVDIHKASLRSLRRQIGLVTQDTIIFTDTIRNNIAYADPRATDEQVCAAAKAAHAEDFIANVRSELTGRETVGYDAIVSNRTLSGGQKQRIAIARAVLNNPAVLIFDEATSQVDADSEKKIQEALAELTKGRTTLIIAHRLSTVINASRIAVMDCGRIVALGTHQHLLATCGEYRKFCDAQMRHG
jgi:ABC-type multidrug transport system fused ATPase/permease subunit